MSIDKTLRLEVDKLKKNLLKLINVRPFAAEAQFQDPCQSFVLPEVICGFCSSCRDIDLLKDVELVQDDWKCSECKHSYDKVRLNTHIHT